MFKKSSFNGAMWQMLRNKRVRKVKEQVIRKWRLGVPWWSSG